MKKAIALVMLLALLLVACETKTGPSPQPVVQETFVSQPAVQDTSVPPQSTEQQTAPPSQPVKEFNVEAFQFGYEPSEIHVKQGDRVRINLRTRDVSHSFTIREFGVSIPAAKDQPGTGEFIADQKGTFMWFCNIPCGSGHKQMHGKLVVE